MTSATAVLISGQTRTFKHCYPTQRWGVYRKLNNPHFFVSVTDDEQAADTLRLQEDYPGRVWIEKVQQPAPHDVVDHSYAPLAGHAPWGISVPPIAIFRQAWALRRVWQFFEEIICNTPIDALPGFSTFVRIRPDLHIHNFTLPTGQMPVYAPWWGSWGGCPDRLAVIHTMDAARAYFTMFDQIDTLLRAGCPFHPETMLAAALELGGIAVSQTLDAEFTTIRMAGDKRPHDKPSYSNRDVFRYLNERLAADQGWLRSPPSG